MEVLENWKYIKLFRDKNCVGWLDFEHFKGAHFSRGFVELT
jgi:hypothetical protein